ncbi:methyltransferase domain-containing protein [Nitrospira calida]
MPKPTFSCVFYDGQDLPYPDGHSDVVFSFNVFEHLPELKTTLSAV